MKTKKQPKGDQLIPDNQGGAVAQRTNTGPLSLDTQLTDAGLNNAGEVHPRRATHMRQDNPGTAHETDLHALDNHGQPVRLANEGSGGEGHIIAVNQGQSADPDPILIIRGHQRKRVATIKAQMRLENQVGALVRTGMGWRMDLPESDRSKIAKAAAKLTKAIESGDAIEPEHQQLAADVTPFILASREARKPFDKLRKDLERVLEDTAATLPVRPWVDGVRGFGLLGLSIIVGESGDLSDYANPAKLWKRLGLAPAGCYRMTCKDGSETNAIPRRRRSAIWTLGDSLLKGNGDGPYRKVYLERKAYEIQRDPTMTKMHAHRRAQRYAEKRLLRDLWRAWRDAVTKIERPAA